MSKNEEMNLSPKHSPRNIINVTNTEYNINLTKCRVISSFGVIIYIWLLPVLSEIGFSEKDATTISGFIANAHATGALAALSFTPLCLMWEYQAYLLSKKKFINALYYSLSAYQFFYGSFLVCTVNYVPEWLHTTTVVLFSTAFVGHSCVIMYYVPPTALGKLDLTIGIIGCIALIFAKGLWFWFFECVGFSSMILFTPIEIYNL